MDGWRCFLALVLASALVGCASSFAPALVFTLDAGGRPVPGRGLVIGHKARLMALWHIPL